MNRGVLQSSPVQQMMAGNPNLWNINSMRPPSSPQTSPFLQHPNFFPPPPSSSSSWDDNQGLPESWSQLLFGRLVEEDERGHLHGKKMESWEEQVLHHSSTSSAVNVKRENHQNSFIYGHANEEFQAAPLKPTWSQMMPVSSPKSCVTSFSSNMLDFSTNKADGRHPPPDPFSECNSTATGGAVKRARNQPAAATQSKLKVRKEKLGDRVTALHQLVSPFGKTDTASVLLEAIGYIRFLQSQIEALSLPYLGVRQQQHSVQGERNCIFPEDPGQLLNDNCIKRKGAYEQESVEEGKKDLRSRGLCLVPLSCTLQVGSDSGADYWAPSSLGGGFR